MPDAACGRLHFPRVEPAVIMLVESQATPRRCLLARHKGSAAGSYSTLAGFVDVSESLEDAVRREVAEETGVLVGTVTYMASQGWPFPAGLMIGFRASAASETVSVDGAEVLEARWFTRAQLTEYAAAGGRLGREDSIDRYLCFPGWGKPDDAPSALIVKRPPHPVDNASSYPQAPDLRQTAHTRAPHDSGMVQALTAGDDTRRPRRPLRPASSSGPTRPPRYSRSYRICLASSPRPAW